jgi:hypothetical protein
MLLAFPRLITASVASGWNKTGHADFRHPAFRPASS